MKAKTKILLALAVIGFLAAAGYMQYRYDSHYDYFARRQTFVTMPSGKTLKILSFGYRNLMADMLFIWSIQFYSNYNLTNSYDYLEHVYNTITDITPLYKEPYMVGSWIMALEAGDVKMAMRLLQKGAKNMPEEWIFDYELGFYAYKYLKDYKMAEIYFNRAAESPKAPTHVRRKYAHMAYMSDNLEYAYSLWLEIYKTAEDLMARDSARNHLMQIKFEMDKKWLEQRINVFKKLRNRFPRNLGELQQAGLAAKIPQDFYGNPYIYNPKTGTVTAQRVIKWKKWL